MSVVLSEDEFYPGTDEVCLLCQTSFEDSQPVVMWYGGEANLYLHGGCTTSFVLKLARDAWQLERDMAIAGITLTPLEDR